MEGEPDVAGSWPRIPLGGLTASQRIGTGKRGSGNTNIPLLKMGSLEWGAVNYSQVEEIDEAAAEADGAWLQPGDILFNTRNTPELVGKTALWTRDERFSFDNNILRLRLLSRAEPAFVASWMACRDGRKAIKRFVKASTSVGAIYWDDLKTLALPLPPLPEQRRIAAVLDAWDGAIALSERLLAAKRRRRDGMRIVLIGTSNLRPLPDLASIRFSGIDKKIDPQERPVRLCNYMDVFGNERIVDALPFSAGSATAREIDRFALREGDVLFTKDSETPEDIAACAAVVSAGPDLVCGYHLGIARPKEGQAIGAYLAHAIRAPFVRSQFVKRVNGVTRFGLTLESVTDIEVPAPPIEQQRSIAALLDALTDEIDLLAARTDLLRTQKRGLMQRLLTGEVRVPETLDALMPAVPPREAAE